jgi:hypothetical protein
MRRFTRTDVNFCLDATLLLLFVALCTFSVIVEFLFPGGPQAKRWLLWGKSYNEWSRSRFGILAVMASLVLLHLLLHWRWICGVVAKTACVARSRELPVKMTQVARYRALGC